MKLNPETTKDLSLYCGTVATGWIAAALVFSGWKIPHLFSLDAWWKWLIAAPCIIALSILAGVGFFAWLGSIEPAGHRINAMVRSMIARRWPNRQIAVAKAWTVFQILLFLPWAIAFLSWGMNYGE